MSIEAMRQALVALEHAVPRSMKQAKEQINAIQALRTAIQQAEAHQPATPEPVAEPFVATYSSESIGGKQHDTGRVNKGPRGGFFASTASFEDASLIADALNAYTHPAPGVQDTLKDHQIAAMVNTLRDIARQFHGHDSLRERIANVLVPALKAEAQQPATTEPVYQICKADSVSISTAWVDVQKQQYDDAALYPEYGRRVLYTHPAAGDQDGYVMVPLKATPKVAMVLYEGARNCFSPKVAEGLWQDALTAAQAQKSGA